jgi:hypothetical protein
MTSLMACQNGFSKWLMRTCWLLLHALAASDDYFPGVGMTCAVNEFGTVFCMGLNCDYGGQAQGALGQGEHSAHQQ